VVGEFCLISNRRGSCKGGIMLLVFCYLMSLSCVGRVIFMVNINVEPISYPSEYMSIIPSLLSTMCLHIMSPILTDSSFVESYVVICYFSNIANNFYLSSSLIPRPLSITWTISFSDSRSYAALILTDLLMENLRAFFTRFTRTYFRRILSPIRYSGSFALPNPGRGSVISYSLSFGL